MHTNVSQIISDNTNSVLIKSLKKCMLNIVLKQNPCDTYNIMLMFSNYKNENNITRSRIRRMKTETTTTVMSN